MRVCLRDTAALAAPDSVTLKCCCCREPLRCLHGGCANPAAPGGLCWGSQRLQGPSPGSCQVGRTPGGNSSAPFLGKGLPQPAGGLCQAMPAGPLTALPQGCTHTRAGEGRGAPLPLLLQPPALAGLEESSQTHCQHKPITSQEKPVCRGTAGWSQGVFCIPCVFTAPSQAAGKAAAPTAQHSPRAQDSPLAREEAKKEGPTQGNCQLVIS